jgi:uncharacterized phiE125 gp8 family phage protein
VQLFVTVPPAAEAISLDEAKLHLRVDGSDDDEEITGFIVAARERAEQELQRPLLPQTCEARGDAFPCGKLKLWKDVRSVTSVQYKDDSGAVVTLPADQYRLMSREFLSPVGTWPRGTEVVVTFICGAFDADAVPSTVIAWMKIQLGGLYENREAVTTNQRFEAPGRFADGLLDRWRAPEL